MNCHQLLQWMAPAFYCLICTLSRSGPGNVHELRLSAGSTGSLDDFPGMAKELAADFPLFFTLENVVEGYWSLCNMCLFITMTARS